MPSQHAKFSPSAADRWISCPASIGMTERHGRPKDDHGSSYAIEGTIAHTLAEIEVGHKFGLISRQEYLTKRKAWRAEFDAQKYTEGQLKDMQAHIRDFVQFVSQRLLRYPGSRIKTEQRLNTGVPDSWGTSDIVIYSDKHIEIIDLKYGLGIPVIADGNSQLRLYACGALDRFGDILADTEEIYVSVFQPRLDAHSTEFLTPAQLRNWRDTVATPAALEAQGPNPRFGPSEKACHYCPVAGICRVRAEFSAQEDFAPLADELEFTDPEVLSPAEVGKLIERLPMIKAWCDAVADYALDAAYSHGVKIPGYKVVKSGGKRSITDHEGMIKALVAMGKKQDEIAVVKAKGIGELEKLVGKPVFKEKLEQFVTKGSGSEALVSEDDPRDEVNPEASAAADFANLEEP